MPLETLREIDPNSKPSRPPKMWRTLTKGGRANIPRERERELLILSCRPAKPQKP